MESCWNRVGIVSNRFVSCPCREARSFSWVDGEQARYELRDVACAREPVNEVDRTAGGGKQYQREAGWWRACERRASRRIRARRASEARDACEVASEASNMARRGREQERELDDVLMKIGDHFKAVRASRARCRRRAAVARPVRRRRCGVEGGARCAGVEKLWVNRAEATVTRAIGADIFVGARREFFANL